MSLKCIEDFGKHKASGSYRNK